MGGDLGELFDRLARSEFRSRFRLRGRELEYLHEVLPRRRADIDIDDVEPPAADAASRRRRFGRITLEVGECFEG